MPKTLTRRNPTYGSRLKRKDGSTSARRKYQATLTRIHLLSDSFSKGGKAFAKTLKTAPSSVKMDVVPLSGLRSLMGRGPDAELKGAAAKVSQYFEKMGYALAMVPLAEEENLEHVIGTVSDDDEGGPSRDPYEEGRKAVEQLKSAEGGAVDRNEAIGRLDIGLAQLYNRIKDRKLVTWVDAAGRRQFPKWQFGMNGLLPGIQDCLDILGDVDEWAVMRFFLTPSESAGGVTPLELIRAGKIKEAKAMAQQVAHG